MKINAKSESKLNDSSASHDTKHQGTVIVPQGKTKLREVIKFFSPLNRESVNFVHDREIVSFDPWHVTLSPLIPQSKKMFELRGITAKIVYISHTHNNFIYHVQHKAHALLRYNELRLTSNITQNFTKEAKQTNLHYIYNVS